MTEAESQRQQVTPGLSSTAPGQTTSGAEVEVSASTLVDQLNHIFTTLSIAATARVDERAGGSVLIKREGRPDTTLTTAGVKTFRTKLAQAINAQIQAILEP